MSYVQQHDGGYWVADTRVSLDSVAYRFLEGLSPESIVDSFETLTLEQVYGAVAYYLGHRDKKVKLECIRLLATCSIALSGGSPGCSVQAIDQHRVPKQLRAPLEALSDPFGDTDRSLVIGVDDADDMLSSHLGKRIIQGTARPLGGIAFSPRVAAQDPAKLEAGPTLRIEETDSAQEAPGRSFLDCPNAVAFQVPMADNHGHLPPGFPVRERLAIPEVANDLGVGNYSRVLLEVIFAKHSQRQPISL